MKKLGTEYNTHEHGTCWCFLEKYKLPMKKKKTVKRFRFPNHISRVNVPFVLDDYAPWQEQVAVELEKTRERMGASKSARWGYKIENGYAEIYITKSN